MFAKRKQIQIEKNSPKAALLAPNGEQLSSLVEGKTLPVVLTPQILANEDLNTWIDHNRALITEILLAHGALLLRGFDIDDSEKFSNVIRLISKAELLPYQFRSTPRSSISGHVYSSTEYPKEEWIPLHNEQSYTSTWPLQVYFCCQQPAAISGDTPIADSRQVYEAIPQLIRDEFERKGIRYLRTYGEMDLSYQEVFSSGDKDEIKRQCESMGIQSLWSDEGQLSTWQDCPAVVKHPKTGEKLWFNQAHLFHVYAKGEDIAEALIAEFGIDHLPRHAQFADGSEIPLEYLKIINAVYEKAIVRFPWHKGDVLILDNMMAAHGRTDFQGERKILVGMTNLNRSINEQVVNLNT